MRLRRRRVFISYSLKEEDLRDELAEWLRDHGMKPVYDDSPEEPEETVLAENIAAMLRNAECVIVLGTRRSLDSTWVRHEVAYAAKLRQRPYYLPVLAEPIPHDELPGWFLRKEPLVGGVKYLRCFDGRARDDRFAALSRPIEEVRRGSPITLGAAVVLALFLLLVVPLLLWWTLRPVVDSADGDVRDAQLWVEKLNTDIERSSGEEDRSLVPVITGDDGYWVTEVDYRDRATGALLAHDTFDDRSLVRRSFFRAGREVAFDTVAMLRAPSGAVSQVKMRRIFPRGAAGPTIEDMFDSDGKLISKRMRTSAKGPWRYLAERGRTLYAVYPFLAAYR
jgi:hypothetical protein